MSYLVDYKNEIMEAETREYYINKVKEWVSSANRILSKKMSVLDVFPLNDEEKENECIAIELSSDMLYYGLVERMCEATGLRFYGVHLSEGKLICLLFLGECKYFGKGLGYEAVKTM